jgi:hypothetical protein
MGYQEASIGVPLRTYPVGEEKFLEINKDFFAAFLTMS